MKSMKPFMGIPSNEYQNRPDRVQGCIGMTNGVDRIQERGNLWLNPQNPLFHSNSLYSPHIYSSIAQQRSALLADEW